MKRRDFFKTMGIAGIVTATPACLTEKIEGRGWYNGPCNLIDKFTLEIGEEKKFDLEGCVYRARVDGVYTVGDGSPAVDLAINGEVKTYLLQGKWFVGEKLLEGDITDEGDHDGRIIIEEVYDLGAELKEPYVEIGIYEDDTGTCESGEGDAE